MGLMEWLFHRERKRDSELLSSLLQLQAERIKNDTEIEKLDREIKLQTRRLELENLERISEEKRKDTEARARLREQRRQWAASAREKKAQKGAARASAAGLPGCSVCADPSSPKLTAEEITWHLNGHPGAMN